MLTISFVNILLLFSAIITKCSNTSYHTFSYEFHSLNTDFIKIFILKSLNITISTDINTYWEHIYMCILQHLNYYCIIKVMKRYKLIFQKFPKIYFNLPKLHCFYMPLPETYCSISTSRSEVSSCAFS